MDRSIYISSVLLASINSVSQQHFHLWCDFPFKLFWIDLRALCRKPVVCKCCRGRCGSI